MIEPWDESKWGPLNEDNMRRKLMAAGYSVARYVYPKGTVFSDHIHSVDKKDAVVEGEFLITMGGEEFLLRAGDAIEVPRDAVHSAQVVGDESVVSMDAVKQDLAPE